MNQKCIVKFHDAEKEDAALVSSKGVHLGEIIQAGVPIPPGFIITVHAYETFFKENKLKEKIQDLLLETNFEDKKLLESTSRKIKNLILKGKISDELTKQIFHEYKMLGEVLQDALVVMKSLVLADNLHSASKQQEIFLNVKGEANVLIKIKEAWASLFDTQAISNRLEQKYDHFTVGIVILVQKVIASEKSGIIFTINPVTNDKTKIIIKAIYGLKELLMQNVVSPDTYEISKNLLTILNKTIETQRVQLVKKGTENKKAKIPLHKGKLQKITSKEIITLANVGKMLEKQYYFPQEIEWAIEKRNIYITKIRPLTTTHHDNPEFSIPNSQLLLRGKPANPGIASGYVKIIQNAHEIQKISQGDIVVAEEITPIFFPSLRNAAAIVTNEGSVNSYTSLYAREIGIPAIVGAAHATTILHDNEMIAVNGTKGEIYKGGFQAASMHEAAGHIKTATKLYANFASLESAEKNEEKHVDGVCLLSSEFITGTEIHAKNIMTEKEKNEFIEKRTEELEKFCKLFDPRPVIYQSRYIHDNQVFSLELEAIKLVRNKHGRKNLWFMIPLVRTVKELTEIKHRMNTIGLHRTPSFKIWMTIEIPANIIMLDKFLEIGIDGVSIDTSNLTYILMGIDKNKTILANEVYDMSDTAQRVYEYVIKTCHKHHSMSSVFGRIRPELLEKLVKWGITSISIPPDTIEKTRHLLAETERKILA